MVKLQISTDQDQPNRKIGFRHFVHIVVKAILAIVGKPK